MKQRNKIILMVLSTAIVTFAITWSLASRHTINSVHNAIVEVRALNQIARTEAWDRVENFLNKGCNKTALYYINQQQYLSLSSIKSDANNNKELQKILNNRNSFVTKRAVELKKSYNYTVPKCI